MTSIPANDLRALGDVCAVVEGYSRALGGCLAPDVRIWLASPEQGLTAAIESASGVAAGTRALARLAPSDVTMVASVRSDRACWAEVARQAGGVAESCIAGLTYDRGGRVCRLVWLRAPLVPSFEASAGDGAPDARPVLESYLEALMNSRFREAADVWMGKIRERRADSTADTYASCLRNQVLLQLGELRLG